MTFAVPAIRIARVPLAWPVGGGDEPSARWRFGFTLVEVLVVIVILGLVLALLVNGLGSSTGAVRNASVGSELSGLDFALRKYSGLYDEFPPTMLSYTSTASPSFDQNVFLSQVFTRHVRRSFPRYNSHFDEINTAVGHATTPEHPGYVSTSGCDVKSLDAAESLVFWLGGLPHIVWATSTRYEVELTGFSADPAAPFLSKTDQPNRTEMLFEFDPQRLVDSDQDGWPEYVPDFDGTSTGTPPYVYFDARGYGFLPSYPDNWHPALVSPANSWGLARPYLLTYTPDTANDPAEHPLPTNFAASESFQVLCAGADHRYSQLAAFTPPAIAEAQNQFTVYPRGQSIVRGNTTWHPIDVAQYDNLANFLDSTLDKALGAPQ